MAKMTLEERRSFMLTTPIKKLIPKMAIPTIAAMVIDSVYNLVDTLFVSQLGTYATGAVGVNSTLDIIILMAGMFLASGSSSFASRLLGAKKDEHARNVVSTCFFMSLFTGTLVCLFGHIFQVPMLRFFGATDVLLPYSRQYCRFVLLAAPFMASSYVLNQNLRAEGNAVYSMIGMCFGAILNIGLDPLFIFVLDWGVAGASAATAISKIVSWFILIMPYWRKKTLLCVNIQHFRPNWGDAKEVCSMGSAHLARNGLATLANLFLNRVAVNFGESTLAAVSIVYRFVKLLSSICLGFGHGFQPVAGFSWGAKNYTRLKEAYRFSQYTCVIGIGLVSVAIAIFARPIIGMFTRNDMELLRLGTMSLRVQSLAMPFHGFCIMVTMLCNGVGRARGAFLQGISRHGIFFFPLLLPFAWLFGAEGVVCVQAVTDVLCIALSIPIGRKILRDIDRLEQQSLEEAGNRA